MCYTGWQESQTNIGSPLHGSALLGPFNTDNQGKRRHDFIYLILRGKKNILPPNFVLKYFLINGARALPWRQFSYFQEWAMNKRPSAKKIGFRFQDKLLLQKTGHGESFYISVPLKLWKATESIQLVFSLQWSWFSHSIIFHTTKNNEHRQKKPAFHTQTIYHLALHSIVYSLYHIHQRRL